jgi:hypothetical protein
MGGAGRCSYEIRRTLLDQTSGAEVGMCVLGYRACVNDSITLNRLVDKELPEVSPLRRMRLKMINALGLEKVTFEAAEPEVNLFVDLSQIVQLEPFRPGI